MKSVITCTYFIVRIIYENKNGKTDNMWNGYF